VRGGTGERGENLPGGKELLLYLMERGGEWYSVCGGRCFGCAMSRGIRCASAATRVVVLRALCFS
jgi:hypothetical protein